MPLNIKKSNFVKSATEPSQYPEDIFPEFFFAGKSNAGDIIKLVNYLDGDK